MISTRLVLAVAGLLASLPATADEVIRILAGNITSGNLQSYDPGHGNRIFQGLKPDIALVQEMNVGTSPNKNTQATYRAWVDANFGTTFHYFSEANGNIPNGIVSRYPILASGEWDDTTLTDRDFVWARIDIPGDKDLWAISVHLKASSGDSAQRNNQANQLLNHISANVPAADYLVIGGDFNTTSRTEACINTLSSVFATGSPWPVDQNGDGDTNSGRDDPYDWVIPDADLNARSTPLVIDSRTFTNGLVFDSRVTSPYSFLPSPIQSGDSAATGMQHMAVMRAFSIPVNAAPVITAAADSSSTETVTDPDSSVYEIVRGVSVGLSVTATDDGGAANLSYTWAKTAGPAASVGFSANGTNAARTPTATFTAPGSYMLGVTVTDSPGLTATSSVKIRVVQTAVGLAVSPSSATLAVNGSQGFTASLTDQFGAAMSGGISWFASGGGSINGGGQFTATTAGGPYTITASGSGKTGSASVTVTRASATVSLSGLSQTYDGDPKPVVATTTPAGLAVAVSYDGSSSPPASAGSYPVVATITDPNYQGGASGTLVIAPDPWALWKNTYFTSVERTAGLADDSADPDADGLANLAEYALATDPRTFTAPLVGVRDETGFSITFTRSAGLPGISYGAETSATLGGWTDVPLEVLETGPVETVRARVVPADPAAPTFLRLRFRRE